ncbi:group II intron maturase-specific domain-containing protein [Pasteuria penetrans]|uniref:group II intron maturase-specific domain-containing protein n=1 Tax=Pasteuria penetrans TaxID=86005 RepID=UPI0024826450|nr:group II intron maturase-specific domain-containing protein [Pasteuria penetrans]
MSEKTKSTDFYFAHQHQVWNCMRLAERSNPILRGWGVNYYGAFYPSQLRKALVQSFDDNVLAWWAVCQEVVQEMKVARPFVTG